MGFKAKAALVVCNIIIAKYGLAMGVEFALEFTKFKLKMCLFGAFFGFAIFALALLAIWAAICENRILLLLYMGLLTALLFAKLSVAGYMLGYYTSDAHKGEIEYVIEEMKKEEKGAFGAFWQKLRGFAGKSCCGCRSISIPEVACPNTTAVSELSTASGLTTKSKSKIDCCEAWENVWSNLMILLASILLAGAVVEGIAIGLAFYVFKDASLLIPDVI